MTTLHGLVTIYELFAGFHLINTGAVNCLIMCQNARKNGKMHHSSEARRMAIANGTCVSFCNQPKAHYLATSREPKTHFGLPWVRPWDNRGKCYMDRKRIQCLSNASQHVAATQAWNRLPTELKLMRSTPAFKRCLKTFFFKTAYSSDRTNLTM